jgi:hypothetical protein
MQGISNVSFVSVLHKAFPELRIVGVLRGLPGEWHLVVQAARVGLTEVFVVGRDPLSLLEALLNPGDASRASFVITLTVTDANGGTGSSSRSVSVSSGASACMF